MNKDIKDYLHLYLGCNAKVDTSKPDCLLITGEIIEIDSLCIDYCIHGNLATVLPILRPLSDMTDEELQECGNMVYDFSSEPELNDHKWQDFEIGLAPEQFYWLIKRHFDLFGLIEAGLAIDGSKFKRNV